jgi:hypothetical protein
VTVGKVSFGQVIAVTADEKKSKRLRWRLNAKIENYEVMHKDATSYFRNSISSYALGNAAKHDNKVDIYITGDELHKVRNHEKPDWDSLEGILSHMGKYFMIDRKASSESDVYNYIVSTIPPRNKK